MIAVEEPFFLTYQPPFGIGDYMMVFIELNEKDLMIS
jgi:hypothetical protein